MSRPCGVARSAGRRFAPTRSAPQPHTGQPAGVRESLAQGQMVSGKLPTEGMLNWDANGEL